MKWDPSPSSRKIIRNNFFTQAHERVPRVRTRDPDGFITNSQWQFFTVLLLELRNYMSALWFAISTEPGYGQKKGDDEGWRCCGNDDLERKTATMKGW